jgi:hypothetical protein
MKLKSINNKENPICEGEYGPALKTIDLMQSKYNFIA